MCQFYEKSTFYSTKMAKMAKISKMRVLFKSGFYWALDLSRCGYNSRACTIQERVVITRVRYINTTRIKLFYLQKLGTWKPRSDSGDCGSRLEYTNIVGGDDAKLGEFPWMVLLGEC